MKKTRQFTLLALAFLSILVGSFSHASQAHATTKKSIDLEVKNYSTGYFQNGIRTVPARPETDYCALSTMTNFINLVASNYCTIDVRNGVYVLVGYAAPNAGVNCSMNCFASDSFKRIFR